VTGPPTDGAEAPIRDALDRAGRQGDLLAPAHSGTSWTPALARSLVTDEWSVLEPAPAIVTYFDSVGRFVGWRDEGRMGGPTRFPLDANLATARVRAELGLPPTVRVGRTRVVELPPVGWTAEIVFFLAVPPGPGQVLTVWARPDDYRVIQGRHGP